MKADNEPAITLLVYFKSVKNKNMFYKKKTKQNKTKRPKGRKKKAVVVESVSRLIKITHAHNLHVKVLDFVLFTIRT